MPLPILLKLGAAGLGLLFLGGRGKPPVAASTTQPIAERMALVLATNDPNAIRFEAGRLKQEGHPTEAAELEKAAKTLEAEIKAGKRPAPVYPAASPPAAPVGPLPQPPVGPLPPGAVTSPGIPQAHPMAPHVPVIPAGVVLPLPVLPAGTVLHYMPPPAPYDARVQAWQTKLISLGITVGPDGADGKFGANTREATRTFQLKANAEAARQGQPAIAVNGMLDAPTLARAALVYALPKPGAAPPTVPIVVAKAPAAAPVLMPVPMPMPMPMPQAGPVVVQTPAGPIVIPPVAMPAPMPAPIALVPLPVLLPKETLSKLNPGQTKSEKTRLWQNKLVSLGLMLAKDVIGQFGSVTEAATKRFQELANLRLKSLGQPPITVDGVVGPQTIALAALAHAPNSAGALFGVSQWGALGAPAHPLPASPLPGVLPSMMPAPIDPRIALAARLLNDLLSKPGPGNEDRQLVQLFQAQQGLRPSGYYQPGTALALAKLGMIPPPPRYWPSTGRAKAKRNYQRELQRFAQHDPQRREEWEIAARSA